MVAGDRTARTSLGSPELVWQHFCIPIWSGFTRERFSFALTFTLNDEVIHDWTI